MEKIIKDSKEFGLNCQTVFIGGEGYIINNPSAKAVGEACRCVSQMSSENDSNVVQMMSSAVLLAEGLSWLIAGDSSLKDKLSECPLQDLVIAWAEAVGVVLPILSVSFVGELVKFSQSVTNREKTE